MRSIRNFSAPRAACAVMLACLAAACTAPERRSTSSVAAGAVPDATGAGAGTREPGSPETAAVLAAGGRHLANVRIRLRDGVHIVGDVWLPAGAGPFPVVLEYTPYDRGPAGISFRGEAPYWTRHGFAFAIFDARGQGDSEGTFRFLPQEGADGHDVVEWLGSQPWSSGRVGMRGSSYTGANQWLVARERPKHLACITPHASLSRALSELVPYRGGAFSFRWALTWIAGLPDSPVRGAGPVDWRRMAEHRPLYTADVAAHGHELPLYRAFLERPVLDDYWRRMELTRDDYAAISIPSLAFTGWFDGTLPGTVAHFRAALEHSPARDSQFLVIGPWEHMTAPDGGLDYRRDYAPVLRVEELEFPEHAFVQGRDLARRFFEWCLKDGPRFEQAPVRIFLTGSNRWLDTTAFPPPQAVERAAYLAGTAPANGAAGGGRLQWEVPSVAATDTYRYDPRAEPEDLALTDRLAGPIDISPLLRRDDVLVYASAPLAEPLTVAGDVMLVLHAASDARDTDWFAQLEDVAPDGSAHKLGSGYAAVQRARYRHGYDREQLLDPGRVEEYRLSFHGIGHTFRAGHRLRLSVNSRVYPWVHPNPNTGNPIATDKAGPRVAVQTLHHGKATPSRLLLPVIPTPAE